MVGSSKPNKQGKKKSHSQDAEVGTHWVGGGWQEAKTKRHTNPVGIFPV